VHTNEPTAPRRRSVALSGRGPGEMAFLDFGPADRPVALVFLHANGFNALTYRAILAPLGAAGARILAADLRGHGATTLSTETEARTNWIDFRDDLLAFIEVLDIEDVVLSGHSMGATTSLLAAATAPERVRSLVLFDPVIVPMDRPGTSGDSDGPHLRMIDGARRRRRIFPNRAAVIHAYKGRGAFHSWPDDMLADYVTAGFSDLPTGDVELACDPHWEASSYVSQAHDSWDAFSRSRCPIRVLRAEQASTFRLEGHEKELAALGQRVEVEAVPGTSHFLPMERPDLARQTLETALRA
jgi:pimeloyl-ACP methyl ester carboxylesterase